ncbi:DUF2264 domain-containing protein [Aurantimonas sp. MSK8Z-1]|uniref:DUF2264 domain-containing protein n=1 Tax=Mangrovibrevibacter kandeliae TaxID=2968473 RepID=UPI00211878B3|nr:DUF2264 domain-containing protein [Aurantimonas sp. MSK8Z-1]MCW4116002.1 DUF2264 domain-containing protein [Aurantimonas sp. MSK8Z-1]
MILDPVSQNPLCSNPLVTRDDVAEALLDLFDPLLPYFSNGNARVRLDAVAAHFDRAAADLEGFARPLWGLAPFAAGGGDFPHWHRFAQGLANGTDPAHPEFWGRVRDKDQRLVELAAIGFALCLVPQHLWDPQSAAAKANIAAYLLDARRYDYAANNWKFFRVMVDLALERLGIDFDRALSETYLDELDGFYLGEGWYRDGNERRIDHYIAFAMHFYGLIHARLSPPGDPRGLRFRERARAFAPDFRAWFDADGGTLAFGRSMTYRFACAGFWGALAFAEEEALPWGAVKGLYLRHLRWWAERPIAFGDGVLSIGYGYPQLSMSESYNSGGSPYWAFKAFLPLMLPAAHPFWTAQETPLADAPLPRPQRHPGMVLLQTPGNVVALSSGQQNLAMRAGPEKYAKFAYASRYGFSVEMDERGFETAAFDNTLAFSEDGLHYRVRETNETAEIAGDALRARWRPFTDVEVETTLVPAGAWHLRIHRIRSARPLAIAEGGFAIERGEGDADRVETTADRVEVEGPHDVAAIVDLGSSVARRPVAQKPLPNTNLVVSKTSVAQLRGDLPAGETLLVTAVVALPRAALAEGGLPPVPAMPDLAALDARFARDGRTVSAIEVAP